MTKVSFTEDGEFESLDLSSQRDKVEVDDMLPGWALPLLTTPDHWANYSDDAIYETDKRIREWIQSMRSKWSRKGMDRRYSFVMLCEILGLTKVVETRKNYKSIAKVFAYYSTRINKQTTINGKKCKNVYTISPKRLIRKPYSLRLRLEQMEGEGVWQNFRLPKDDLEPGHARNPRTEANMQRRREERRKKANAALRQWREVNGRSKSGPGSGRVHDDHVSDEDDRRGAEDS